MNRLALIASLVLQLCQTAAASSIKELVQFPGAYHTFVNDMDNGVLVGSYQASVNSPYHGFIYDGSTYSTLDMPGSFWTELSGVDGNRIVGTYLGPDRFHGLLYDGTTFTTLDPPDATNDIANGTVAVGIDGDRIVGQYWKGFSQNGFVLDGSVYSTLNYPSGALNSASDVDGNTIVGTYYAAPRYRGYLYDGTSFVTLDHPLGSAGTYATGVSGNRIVGTYYTEVLGQHSVAHGFIYRSGVYTTWDIPAHLGNHTFISSISGNTIVGSYSVLGGPSRGFIAVIPEPCTGLLLAICCLTISFARPC
jgi:hypothetical protein